MSEESRSPAPPPPNQASPWMIVLSLVVVVAVLVFYIVLGCFLDGISMVVLTMGVILPTIQKAGVDLKSFNNSWESFIAACEKVKKAGGVPISFANKEGIVHEFWLLDMMSGAGSVTGVDLNLPDEKLLGRKNYRFIQGDFISEAVAALIARERQLLRQDMREVS